MFHHLLASPIGELLLTSDGDALTGLYLAGHDHTPPLAEASQPDPAPFREAATQLDAYFAGDLTEFTLPLAPQGTPFQREVWDALLTVGYGTTTSYGELAGEVGRPGAARAVGLANGSNPISIVVPCHRVIGADGSLTGYGWGTERKRWLLEMEAGIQRLDEVPAPPGRAAVSG